MNHVTIHDILESDFNAPLTDEALEELGFYIKDDNYAYSMNGVWLIGYKSGKGRAVQMRDHSFPTYKTVGGVKLLIEALKGDES